MKESNLKLAQKDIDEALKAVEEMESYINEGNEENAILKQKFMTLTEKVYTHMDIGELVKAINLI